MGQELPSTLKPLQQAAICADTQRLPLIWTGEESVMVLKRLPEIREAGGAWQGEKPWKKVALQTAPFCPCLSLRGLPLAPRREPATGAPTALISPQTSRSQ